MPRKRQVDLNRVLEVSIALANEHGFEAVTLASVAEQLGIRIPSLYNHVNGLPGLRYQMSLWGLRQLCERMRRAAVGKAGADAIISVAHAYREFALQHPGIYMATLRAPGPEEPELAAISAEIIEVIMAIMQPYGFSTDETLHRIRALRSVLHGFVGLEIAGGFGMPLECDESFRQLLDLLVRGLETG